jgi:hypothetical protein
MCDGGGHCKVYIRIFLCNVIMGWYVVATESVNTFSMLRIYHIIEV